MFRHSFNMLVFMLLSMFVGYCAGQNPKVVEPEWNYERVRIIPELNGLVQDEPIPSSAPVL